MDLITIKHQKGLCFSIKVRGHELLMDMPKDSKGQDEGPSPADLLSASVGACMAMHMVLYCQTAGVSTEGLEMSLVYQPIEENGRKRIKAITVDVTPPQGIGPRKDALLRAAGNCIVRNTLAQGPEIDVAFTDE